MGSSQDRPARQRTLQRQLVAAVLGLCASAAAAVHWHQHPRVAVLLSLAGWLAGWAAWQRLQALQRHLSNAISAVAPSFEAPCQTLQLAVLEAHLNQAPVALWQQRGDEVVALNTAARRLIAPGGAISRDALLQRLAESLQSPPANRALFTFDSERGQERCLLACTDLVVAGQPERLLALMPIESELEAQTLKAWRQLVHVLTHEIMNSLTPIASLSRSAQEMQGDPAQADDLALALEAVARRAEALVRFVADYRRVSEWPEPRLEPVDLGSLFARIDTLVGAQWRARGGDLILDISPATLTLMADAGQLEQALINLLKNAFEATQGLPNPQATLQARLARGNRLRISVRDNGPGVPEGLESDIFLPFFSARAVSATGQAGSGIGLAVVRNLVHGMGGTVRYVKLPQGGACFVLAF